MRAIIQSGGFDGYWRHHLAREYLRLHPGVSGRGPQCIRKALSARHRHTLKRAASRAITEHDSSHPALSLPIDSVRDISEWVDSPIGRHINLICALLETASLGWSATPC